MYLIGASRPGALGWRNRLLSVTSALALVASMGATPAVAQISTPTGSSSQIVPARLAGLSDFVDGVLSEQIAKREVAGAVIAVVHKGRVLFSRGYGFADIERRVAADPQQTLFRPGSVSKLFTWTALMQQVEAGKIDLDAPIERYLDFKLPASRFKPIRVRDLMSHTAGFGDQSKIFVKSQAELIGFRNWMQANPAMRVREPGAEISYSNYGAALAGYIVEQVSGESFDDYVERHIFGRSGCRIRRSGSRFRLASPGVSPPVTGLKTVASCRRVSSSSATSGPLAPVRLPLPTCRATSSLC